MGKSSEKNKGIGLPLISFITEKPADYFLDSPIDYLGQKRTENTEKCPSQITEVQSDVSVFCFADQKPKDNQFLIAQDRKQ